MAPERILKWGTPVRSKSGGTEKIFGRAPPLFGSKSTISRFGERFRDDQYSLVSFLFAVLLLTVPPAPWSQRHCNGSEENSRERIHLIIMNKK